MSDHIPADTLRKLIEEYQSYQEECEIASIERTNHTEKEVAYTRGKLYQTVIWDLENMIPLPTLADMTPEEREKCQWMQADHLNEARGIITLTDPVVVLFEDGRYMAPCPLSHVTPRPDLPKMVWPGSEPDVSKSAPEIDTSTRRADPIDMSPEPQPGEAWRAVWDHYGRTVTAIKRTDGHWWAIDGDEEPHVVARTGITTVTRLVPETPRKTLVTVEDYRNAPVGTVISYPAFFDDGVEDDWIDTAVKYGDGHWRSTGSVGYDDTDGLAGVPRDVLWEPEA